MSAGIYDIVDIEQGCDWALRVQLKDEAGVARDLTNVTLNGQIRPTYSSTTVIAEFVFAKDAQTGDGSSGTGKGWFTMSLPNATTSAIPVAKASGTSRSLTKYIYDVISTEAAIVERELQGNASVSPEVTDETP